MKRILFLLVLVSTFAQAKPKPLALTDQVPPAVFSLTLIMMHDVVDPPAAARYYAYCTMGAYDIVAAHNATIVPLDKVIKNYTCAKVNMPQDKFDYNIASVYCIYETGRLLLPSGFMLEEKQQQFLKSLKKKKIKQSIIDSSVAVAKSVAAQVVNWTKGDGYNKLSTLLQYTPLKGDGYWYPTPPAYLPAVEPNWTTIRPLIIDSCNQFKPLPPVPFNMDSTSKFYSLAKEVHDVVNNLTPEQNDIAGFWDCNPFVVANQGHMSIGFKKMSPGGHWMSIAGIAAETAKLDFDKSVMIQALTGITLMDAFISCWDEKYRSNRIRPETVINRYMDKTWTPILQTPPFPEYTSGHSVISTAAATTLTYLLGSSFSFTDNSEELFELKPRHFNSFREAANEAAISRLYGGIHYRDAIENGQTEGEEIGNFVVEKIKAAGIKPL